jgi:hypothetical protein
MIFYAGLEKRISTLQNHHHCYVFHQFASIHITSAYMGCLNIQQTLNTKVWYLPTYIEWLKFYCLDVLHILRIFCTICIWMSSVVYHTLSRALRARLKAVATRKCWFQKLFVVHTLRLSFGNWLPLRGERGGRGRVELLASLPAEGEGYL